MAGFGDDLLTDNHVLLSTTTKVFYALLVPNFEKMTFGLKLTGSLCEFHTSKIVLIVCMNSEDLHIIQG